MSKQKAPDPRRLSVENLARDGMPLEGRWPVSALSRLLDAVHADQRAEAAAEVIWRARAEWRTPRAAAPQLWLHLAAEASLPLECQRCLGPVTTPVEVDRWFRFVPDEASAAAEDAEAEEDLLVLPRVLDLRELVEDELLLALPLVPRHVQCPEPLPMSTGEVEASDPAVEDDREHPFAALAALRGRTKPMQ